jgi:hypothetical protein
MAGFAGHVNGDRQSRSCRVGGFAARAFNRRVH